MVVFVLIKSAALGIAASLLDVAFIKAALLVALSAFITGLFGIAVALIQSHADRRLHDRLDVIERQARANAETVGAPRVTRSTDALPETPATPS